jgi:hypothetical protein
LTPTATIAAALTMRPASQVLTWGRLSIATAVAFDRPVQERADALVEFAAQK